MVLALFLALSVTLAPPFGEAEARAVEAGLDLVVELTVEVEAGAAVVLARGVGIAGELGPVALSDLGDGRWGGLLTLEGNENIQVAFEAIRPDADDAISELHTLEELGVDPAVLGEATPPADTVATPSSRSGWWLALAAGAGLVALVLVAVWSLRGGRSDAPEETEAAE